MNYQFMNPVGVIISCVKVQKGKLVGMLRNIHFIIKKTDYLFDPHSYLTSCFRLVCWGVWRRVGGNQSVIFVI